MKAYLMSVMLFVLLITIAAGIPTLNSQFASGFVNAPSDLMHRYQHFIAIVVEDNGSSVF